MLDQRTHPVSTVGELIDVLAEYPRESLLYVVLAAGKDHPRGMEVFPSDVETAELGLTTPDSDKLSRRVLAWIEFVED